MTLLALEIGSRLDALRRRGVTWRFDREGLNAAGRPHRGMIVVEKGSAVMILEMVAEDRVELRAEGIGPTRGVASYGRERVTAGFVTEAVERFLRRCMA